jgi:hypothetical protein
MNTRHALVIAATILVSCLIGGFFLGQPTPAQQPAAQPAGRYQLSGAGAGSILVIDTTTGQVWGTSNTSNGQWKDYGRPVNK